MGRKPAETFGPREDEYVRLRLQGESRLGAAERAGFEDPYNASRRLERNPVVKKQLIRRQERQNASWGEFIGKLKTKLDDLLDAQKEVVVRCPSCNKRVGVKIDHYTVQLGAINAGVKALTSAGQGETLAGRAEHEDTGRTPAQAAQEIISMARTTRPAVLITVPTKSDEPS